MHLVRMSRYRKLVLFVLFILFIFHIGCQEHQTQKNRIVVFAASSLQYVLTEGRSDIESQKTDIDITFQFAGSQTLATQIEHGAPVDIFFSAHPKFMQRLQDKKYIAETPISFGNNELVVLQSAKFPLLSSFEDLPQAQSIILGHQNSPIGMYTESVLVNMSSLWRERLEEKIVSRESSVANLRNKVLLGEVHCAIVYRSDAVLTGLPFVPIPENLQPNVVYQVAYIQQGKTKIQPHVKEWVESFLADQTIE